ncbi:MAG: hypothetical protein ABF649_02030 [Bacillus sp. (in: firmicutes)]
MIITEDERVGEHGMVTFAYVLIIGLMSILTVVLDMFVFHAGLKKCVANIYNAEIGAGALTIVLAALLGFVWSIVVDFRMKKNKTKSNPQ